MHTSIRRALVLTSVLLISCGGDMEETRDGARLEANKEVVRQFFAAGMDPDKVLELLHPDYIQHNPTFKRFGEINGVKGREEFSLLVDSRQRGLGAAPPANEGPPPPQGNPTYILMAEGDLVTALQQRFLPDPQNPGEFYEAFWFDTWRVKDGKLYEHWDAAQIPNPPPPFLEGPLPGRQRQ